MRAGKKTADDKSRGKRLRWPSKVGEFFVWVHGCLDDLPVLVTEITPGAETARSARPRTVG